MKIGMSITLVDQVIQLMFNVFQGNQYSPDVFLFTDKKTLDLNELFYTV